MSKLSQSWKDDHGPVSSGLFFPDQTWRAAAYDCELPSLDIGELQPLTTDMVFAEYGDYENGRFTCEMGVIRWGGGPWEGEGWIAFENHDSQLIWLLHLEDSEPFTQVRLNESIIEAVTYEYPYRTMFLIPLVQSHLARCERALGNE